MKESKFKIKNCFRLFCILHFALLIGCVTGSIPNLDQPECADSRETAKKFYSFHFGNEMKFSKSNLKQRERFLTPEFYKSLENLQSENDVFTTNSADFPRAFKLGACQVIDSSTTKIEVLLFWRDDSGSKQSSISAEIIKQSEKWYINKISN